jgi:peptide chain release factor subunit 1
MAMDEHELQDTIEDLREIRGRNTELVSLYIPPDYDIRKIIDFLTQEQSEAENIKSKHTRKNVKSALDKIQRRLKDAGKIPDKGIALFAGNVSEQEGRPDIQLWEIEPPEPVESRMYRCDKNFVIEPLEEVLIETDVYGVICLDKSEAAIGYVRGNTLSVEYAMESNVPGKTTKGGQSQQRFERIRENMYDTFLTDIAEKAKRAFLQKARDDELLGIIIGGPGFAKEDLVEKDYLPKELVDEIIATQGTNYSGEEGLEELLDKSEDIISEAKRSKERKAVKEFLKNLKKDNGLSTYGLEEVAKAVKMGAVETILVSEDFEKKEATFSCPECGHDEVKHISEFEAENEKHPCPDCGTKMDLEEITDVIKMFKTKAAQMNSDLMWISRQHEEGERLWNMGGLAAVLRYRIE